MGKSWFNRLGFRSSRRNPSAEEDGLKIAQGLDEDEPEFKLQFAQFGGGCFWALELAYQRVRGVTKTEAGYSQGTLHNPTYRDVSDGSTGHCEVVRLVYDPRVCTYQSLLDVFWSMHDPTSLNRQGSDVGTQFRSGIFYYTPEQERAARESMENCQKLLSANIVTEIRPAKKFYRAEAFHQQYLARGGRFGFRQSPAKSCTDRIRVYG